MKRGFLILVVLFVFAVSPSSQGQCLSDPYDNGICDTMYVEPWLDDLNYTPGAGPYFIRVPIYVTHDVPDPSIDSIAAFVIPLCYTHSNSAKYCSLSGYWNQTMWTQPQLSRSIFRHLIQGSDTVHNWMMDQYEKGKSEEWNSIILNLDGTSHFWLALIPTGSEDQRFGPENHKLLATMTFKLQDRHGGLY